MDYIFAVFLKRLEFTDCTEPHPALHCKLHQAPSSALGSSSELPSSLSLAAALEARGSSRSIR